MVTTGSIEEYLEAIFELEEIGERVTKARLARWFRVSAPATDGVLHTMARKDLIVTERDGTIRLSDRGRRRAAAEALRHRVIERYLVDVLGVPWHLADDEVRKMEPGISDVVFERMRAAVAGVDRCPHGNPIPGTDAASAPIDLLTPLDACVAGVRMRIDRIREDLELDLEMLRYLEEFDLFPGAEVSVADKDPEGAVTVVCRGKSVAVGPALASHVLCVPA